jgi:hypothetical protein
MAYAIQIIGYDLTRYWSAGNNNGLISSGYAYRSNTKLVGWWRLNEDVSTSGDVTDSSGNGRTGTFASNDYRPASSGKTPSSRYIQDSSCLFDGYDECVQNGTAASWDAILGSDTSGGSTQQMTFSGWYRRTTSTITPGADSYMFEVGNASAGGGIRLFWEDQSGGVEGNWELRARWSGQSDYSGFDDPSGAWSHGDAWFHVVCTYDARDTAPSGPRARLYINGKEIAITSEGVPTGTISPFVGAGLNIANEDGQDGDGWEGQVADFAIWNSILTAEEARAIYQVSKTGAYLITRDYNTRGSVATLSGTIDQFRQGVSVQSMAQRYAGLSPKLAAGSPPLVVINEKLVEFQDTIFDETNQPPRIAKIISGSTLAVTGTATNPLNSASGIISFIPNHAMVRRDFGQPKLFKDDEPFEDMKKWDPVSFMYDCGDSIIYPYILANVSMKDPDQMDGVIEPLAIRSRASLNSIDWPHEAHTVWGLWLEGAEDSRRRACPIVQQIDFRQTNFEPFEDGGYEFMGFTPSSVAVVSGSLKYGAVVSNEGYLHDVPAVITPWVAATDRELYFAPLIKSGSFVNQPDHKARAVFDAVLASNTSDKASSIDDLTERHHKSAPAGYDYLDAEDGTDSIAFGGLKK